MKTRFYSAVEMREYLNKHPEANSVPMVVFTVYDQIVRGTNTYVGGKQHGKFESFDVNGEKLIDGQFEDGLREGTFTYTNNGEVFWTEEWESGKLIKRNVKKEFLSPSIPKTNQLFWT